MVAEASDAPCVDGGTAAVTQISRLLTIPGEIRNRIYELAVENANAWEDEDFANDIDDDMREDNLFAYRKSMLPRLISPARNRFWRSSLVPARLKNWDLFCRKYLGLSQTCHQIRQEFLPMYSKIWVGVDMTELSEYIHDFIVRRAQHPSEYNGCIDIGVEEGHIDIRNFLLLFNKAPNLDARFSIRAKDIYWELPASIPSDLEHALMYARKIYPKFWNFLLEQTTSVFVLTWNTGSFYDEGSERVAASHYIDGVEIRVKPAFVETWMTGSKLVAPQTSLEDWYRKLDLPDGVKIYPCV